MHYGAGLSGRRGELGFIPFLSYWSGVGKIIIVVLVAENIGGARGGTNE